MIGALIVLYVCLSIQALDHALYCLQLEDPSLKATIDEDTGQVILIANITVECKMLMLFI